MAKLTELRNQGALTHLLGFNEPDSKEQANLGVDAAVAAWPFLEATALRLGSPAAVHADGPWMRDFMGKVSAAQGRVDFVTAHWYGGVDADGLIAWLTKIHQQHGKPVWLTEFAPADWSASATNPNRYSRAQVESFMKAVLPKLDALPFLERYAWFSFGTDRAPGGSSALFENDGTRTAAGEVYRNHPVAVAP
jgi:hypothetical protein